MADENNLPRIAGDTLRSTTDANKAAAKQSRALSNQIVFMNIGAGLLTNASISLDKYAKSEQKKKSPLKSLRDMFSLTNVKQKSLQEQQADQIASKLGVTREELDVLQKRKELDESQKKVADEFRENAKKYGVNLEGIKTSFTDMGELLLNNAKDSTATLEETLGATNAKIVSELRDSSVGNKLQKIEDSREKARADAENAGLFKGILQNTEDMEEALIAGFKGMLDKMAEKSGKGIGIGLGLLAAPIMLSIGAIMGLKDSLVKIAKLAKLFTKMTVIKPLQGMFNFFKGIGNKFAPKQMEQGARAISKFTTSAKTFFNGVATSFRDAPKTFKAGMDGLKVFRTATGQFGKLGFFGKVGAVVGKAIKPFKGILTALASGFNKVKTIFAPIVDNVSKMANGVKTAFNGTGTLGKFFGAVKSAFAPIVKMAGTIGRVIGRAFYPITVLMTIFDGIQGFIKGFKANGIIGAISGAFFGIIDGLVMKVLDLIKSLFSWIFGALGFDGISAALDSFSFSEIWQGLGDKIQEFITAIKNWVGDKISGLVDGFVAVLDGFKVNGIIGGLSAAFFGIIDMMVMKTLDLIKGVVSWVGDKLGFSGFSEALDSFSFSDIWQSVGDKVQEFLTMIKNWVGDKVASLIDGVKGIFGFGDSDEEKAEKEKNKKRAADLHAANKKAAAGDAQKSGSSSGVTPEQHKEITSSMSGADSDTGDVTPNIFTTDELASMRPQAQSLNDMSSMSFAKMDALENDATNGNRFASPDTRKELTESLGGRGKLDGLADSEGLNAVAARKLLSFDDIYDIIPPPAPAPKSDDESDVSETKENETGFIKTFIKTVKEMTGFGVAAPTESTNSKDISGFGVNAPVPAPAPTLNSFTETVKNITGFGDDSPPKPALSLVADTMDTSVSDDLVRKYGVPPEDDYEAGSLEAIQADFMRAADAKFDAMDGVEINARSQAAAGATNIISVVAPQTSNVVQTSQNMNQTVAVPASPTPSVASRRSGGRNSRVNR